LQSEKASARLFLIKLDLIVSEATTYVEQPSKTTTTKTVSEPLPKTNMKLVWNLISVLFFLSGSDAYSLIKLKKKEDLCLQCVQSCNLKLCEKNWRTMRWTYEVGDLYGPYGGGQLRNDKYGWCATNNADPGESDYQVIMDPCEFDGPAYTESFSLFPAWKDDGKVKPEEFLLVHLGDGTCLTAKGESENDLVRLEMCGDTPSSQEFQTWKIENARDFYVDN